MTTPHRSFSNRVGSVLRALRLHGPVSHVRRALTPRSPSETSKCRARLAPYCQGYGVDLGFGGDPITPHAIRVDLPSPYTDVGDAPVQLGGDCAKLVWFRDGTLDFVYSSHLLEDFVDTRAALVEWLRVLKPGGRLIIFCPDEQRFRAHCARTGQTYNPNHKHAHFSLAYVEQLLASIGGTRVLLRTPDRDIYSWDLVVEKIAKP
jgi:predicted SAM-dependent methyltransferase